MPTCLLKAAGNTPTKSSSRSTPATYYSSVAGVDMVVAGEGRAAVCYDCIRLLGQVVEEEAPAPAKKFEPSKPLAPREIFSNLDAYVVGQEKAKIRTLLSVNTGQTYDKIARDTDRDYYLTAEQAVEYSLVDEILGAKQSEDNDS